MFSIKKILKDTYNLYLNKFVTIIGVTSILFFLLALSDNIVESAFSYSIILGIVLGVLLGVIGIVIEIGYLKYFLKLLSGGFPVVEDLLRYTNLFWKYILGNILFVLTVLIGLIVFIVPGIYLFLRFMFVPLLIIDQDMKIKEAFKKSTEITSGVKWKLFGFVIVMTLIQSAVGLLSFHGGSEIIYATGAVLVSPFVAIAYLKAYRNIMGLDS